MAKRQRRDAAAERILVVDDEAANLDLYPRCLRPFKLLYARDGTQALQLLRRQSVDLVIKSEG